ncbi:hypothetical protein ACTPD5_21080, partial [Clostridioides difficile]|uniref:hypothetical protein n=1 Tax=Clostridioides difficile TaxID=1496 RepID=UPI003F8D48A3
MNKKLDKNVELITIGAETEVDKSVIDNLAEPFMHLIRNAMDHGWKSGTTRIAVFATVHKEASMKLMDIFKEVGLGAYVGKVNMNM